VTCAINAGIRTALWPHPLYPFNNAGSSNGSWYFPDGTFEPDPKKAFDRLTRDSRVVWVQLVCNKQVTQSYGVPAVPVPQAIPGGSPPPGAGAGGLLPEGGGGSGEIATALKRNRGSLLVIGAGLAVLFYLRRGRRKRR
jgi:hypothetical protein